MPKLKFFTDENIPNAIIEQLRRRDIDVVRCQDVGMTHTDDELLLEYATKQERTILSFDRDFERIHSEWKEQGKNHCGIFRCLHHLEGEKGIGRIVTFISNLSDLIEGGAGSLEKDVYNKIERIN